MTPRATGAACSRVTAARDERCRRASVRVPSGYRGPSPSSGRTRSRCGRRHRCTWTAPRGWPCRRLDVARHRSADRRVAAVHEAVEADLLDAMHGGEDGEDLAVALHGVHAARGHEARAGGPKVSRTILAASAMARASVGFSSMGPVEDGVVDAAEPPGRRCGRRRCSGGRPRSCPSVRREGPRPRPRRRAWCAGYFSQSLSR